MSRAIPIQTIFEKSLNGVQKAFNDYYEWTNCYWLCHAPESYIQVEIARSLKKEFPFITLEDTVRAILKDSDAEIRGRMPRSNSSGRVDIIVWWNNETPRALIEVKKSWTYDAINSDAKRLRQLLNRGGSIQCGIIVVYTDARNEETINSRFKNMELNSDTKIKLRLGPMKRKEENQIWYWDAACFLVNK